MAANSPSPPPSNQDALNDSTTAASPPPALPNIQGLLEEAQKAYEQEDMKKMFYILLQSIAALTARLPSDAPAPPTTAPTTNNASPKIYHANRPLSYAEAAARASAPKPI